MRNITILIMTVVLIVGAVLYILTPRIRADFGKMPNRTADPSTQRHIEQGKLVGYLEDFNTHAWMGIPFAKAPIGPLRWRAPQAPEPWPGTFSATEQANNCSQLATALTARGDEIGKVQGSEDCLYLNVYSPGNAQASDPLPVMVWIHGGGNSIGSAYWTPYAHKLAGTRDVVVVTIHYRLNALGWLLHPALEGETAEDRSGNYGTLDQIAALRWVQENIAAFGGDPAKVTIFGESAGGRNVFALMTSPLAKGLFHRAISQSGGPAHLWTVQKSRALVTEDPPGRPGSSGELLLRLLQQDDEIGNRDEAIQRLSSMTEEEIRDFLYSRSADQILQANDKDHNGKRPHKAQLIRDGHVLPERHPTEIFSDSRRYNSVPFITGSNRNEQTLFQMRNPKFVRWWFGVIPQVTDPEGYRRYEGYWTDSWKASAVDWPAETMSAAGAEVYAYRFDWNDYPDSWLVDLRQLLGATHGLEIPFVFNASAAEDSFIPGGFSEANAQGVRAMAEAMSSYWAEFAYTGNPGRGRDGTLPEWPAWQAPGPQFLILDSEAGGGIRTSSEIQSEAGVKDRLLADVELIGGQAALCELYARLFLYSDRGIHGSLEEYLRFGEQGCADYPPENFDNGGF